MRAVYRPDLIGCAYSATCGDENTHGPRGLCHSCRAPTAEETAAWERQLAETAARWARESSREDGCR